MSRLLGNLLHSLLQGLVVLLVLDQQQQVLVSLLFLHHLENIPDCDPGHGGCILVMNDNG